MMELLQTALNTKLQLVHDKHTAHVYADPTNIYSVMVKLLPFSCHALKLNSQQARAATAPLGHF